MVTARCVYNELAGNRHVFTLDLIASTPALLLLTVFRARLSAAAGSFKVCVCGVWGGGTFVDGLVSLVLFVPETWLKGRKSFKWSVRSHTNVATHHLRSDWASVCISRSFDLQFSAKILMGSDFCLVLNVFLKAIYL